MKLILMEQSVFVICNILSITIIRAFVLFYSIIIVYCVTFLRKASFCHIATFIITICVFILNYVMYICYYGLVFYSIKQFQHYYVLQLITNALFCNFHLIFSYSMLNTHVSIKTHKLSFDFLYPI